MSKALGEHEFIIGDATSPPLSENSIHAVVTDPPYGINFVPSISSWDDFEPDEYQDWCREWGEEILRILKPGGHILSFSGTRTFHRMYTGLEEAGFEVRETVAWVHGEGWPKNDNTLKPSFEPIFLGRKPLRQNTVKGQIESSGTGFLNIEETSTEEGRHPANLVLDEKSAEHLDSQSGITKSTKTSSQGGWNTPDVYNDRERPEEDGVSYERGYDDLGGASRFFYTAKVRKTEKTHNGKVDNTHKTVKPVDLMEWLVKLVTKEGQTVLDPFMGSGSTLLACDNTHREGIGIDMNPEWVEISRKRMKANRGRLETNSIQDW